jgi:hypothetical protein
VADELSGAPASAGGSPLRRVDLRFALPQPVRQAAVLGGLAAWRDGLAQAGAEVIEPGSGRPDLVVAPRALAQKALAVGAGMVVLEGPARRRLERAGLAARQLLVRPRREEPSLVVPLDERLPARYAAEHLSLVDRRWKLVRAAVAKGLIQARLFPSLPSTITVGSREPGPPYLVAGAAELGVPPASGWVLALGLGDVLSRNLFYLFPPGQAEPAWVLKFARLPGYREPFDRDQHGLELAARAGDVVARHAPRLLGRLHVEGIHASLETAAPGRRLRDLLLRPGHRRDKLRLIDRVADWIVAMHKATSAPPETLAPELDRLRRQVLPLWADHGASADLVDALPPLPAVLQHNDLGSWNIAVGSTTFTVVDWESARERGLPLWDLFYFLADALALLDGCPGGATRPQHTTRLFRGELPTSPILFRWTRRAADALRIPRRAVGPLATLCWLHHARSPAQRAAALDAYAPGSAAPLHGTEQVAGAWLADPALGLAWQRWQTSPWETSSDGRYSHGP